MGYPVRAWRDSTGNRGVDIGARTPVGWDNVVAEIILIGEEEVEALISEIRSAWERAQTFEETTHEPMPGPYDGGWD